MPERKTVGQLMEEMRLKAGAQNYHGHEYMDLERFAEDTRHMIIFDVLTPRFAGGLERRTDPPVSDGGRIPEKPGEPGKGPHQDSQPCQGAPGTSVL